jgi:hypothetical protein
MTRRQIYALLPPRRTPSALPPSVFAVAGIPIYAHHSELHSLDADFSLFVQYRVANRREYPSRWLPLPNAPNALDRLLHGGVPDQRRVPSKQNADDELVARPTLRGPTVPYSRSVIEFSTTTSFDDLTISPSRRAKSQ